MDVYVLCVGQYREESPVAVYATTHEARVALEAAQLAEPFTDPFVMAFQVNGAAIDADVVASEHVAAEVARLRAQEAADSTQRARDAVARGELVYSTAPISGGAISLDFVVSK